LNWTINFANRINNEWFFELKTYTKRCEIFLTGGRSKSRLFF
jgi:hypothetical protein